MLYGKIWSDPCLAEIKALLDNRSENDTSPYMVCLFNRIYVKYYGVYYGLEGDEEE